MSVETTPAKTSQEIAPAVELIVALAKAYALMTAVFSEEDRADLAEVLQVMGQSQEEMEGGEETIREILQPKVGSIVSPFLPPAGSDKAKKWSSYVGDRVREFRRAAGLTQQELSAKAELPQSHLSRIEQGDVSPNRRTVEKLAAAMNKTVADFDPSGED